MCDRVMWGRRPRRRAGFHAGLSSRGQKPVGNRLADRMSAPLLIAPRSVLLVRRRGLANSGFSFQVFVLSAPVYLFKSVCHRVRAASFNVVLKYGRALR